MRKYIYVIVGLVCAFMIYAYITADRTSDREKLTNLIADVVDAANSRSLGRCMEYVSNDFKAQGDINKERLRLLAAQAFRSEPNFNVQAVPKNIDIRDGEASAVIDVVVKDWDTMGTIYDGTVNVKFKKEKTRRLLFLPADTWRATYIDSFVVDGGEQLF